jgi:nickel/cobalt exporter
MADFSSLLQQGAGNAWLFVPSAMLLGALHGLEPGHSKTMMAAFIVAVRGSMGQAVLLGLATTLSHTAVVWVVALGGMYFGRNWTAESSTPYLQLASAVLIMGVALWMLWRAWRDQQAAKAHAHGHPHDHSHDDHRKKEEDQYQDAHARMHAEDIRQRFTNREVSTGQIVLFGLTGGLLPCPASITVLLLCLQLKEFTLGAGLVLCFSAGLALTLVFSGVAAAWGVKHAAKRWSGFGEVARKAPYVSSAVILLVGLYVGYEGLQALP